MNSPMISQRVKLLNLDSGLIILSLKFLSFLYPTLGLDLWVNFPFLSSPASFCLFVFFGKGCYIAYPGLELTMQLRITLILILLSLPSRGQDYRNVLPQPAQIDFSFIHPFCCLATALGCICYFGMTYSVLSQGENEEPCLWKSADRSGGEADANARRMDSVGSSNSTVSYDIMSETVRPWGTALSHKPVYFHQSSPRPIVIFPFLPMFLSFFERKKKVPVLELS